MDYDALGNKRRYTIYVQGCIMLDNRYIESYTHARARESNVTEYNVRVLIFGLAKSRLLLQCPFAKTTVVWRNVILRINVSRILVTRPDDKDTGKGEKTSSFLPVRRDRKLLYSGTTVFGCKTSAKRITAGASWPF